MDGGGGDLGSGRRELPPSDRPEGRRRRASVPLPTPAASPDAVAATSPHTSVPRAQSTLPTPFGSGLGGDAGREPGDAALPDGAADGGSTIRKRRPDSSPRAGNSVRNVKRFVANVRTGSTAPGEEDPSPDDESALRAAALSNATEDVRTLLEVHRVSPNASDGRGRAPLHFASSNGNVSIVALLIQYGANVEVADVNGNRPLHLAISSNHMAVVNELLKAGARPESGNGSNKTPLDLATSRLTMIKRRSESSLNQEPLSGRASQNGPPRDAHERWEQDMNFAGWTREELIKQIEEILALLRYSVPIKVVEEDRHRGSGDVATRPPLDSTRPPLDLHRTVPNEVDDAREIDELIGRLAGLATSAASQHDSDFDEVVSGVEALMKRLQLRRSDPT